MSKHVVARRAPLSHHRGLEVCDRLVVMRQLLHTRTHTRKHTHAQARTHARTHTHTHARASTHARRQPPIHPASRREPASGPQSSRTWRAMPRRSSALTLLGSIWSTCAPGMREHSVIMQAATHTSRSYELRRRKVGRADPTPMHTRPCRHVRARHTHTHIQSSVVMSGHASARPPATHTHTHSARLLMSTWRAATHSRVLCVIKPAPYTSCSALMLGRASSRPPRRHAYHHAAARNKHRVAVRLTYTHKHSTYTHTHTHTQPALLLPALALSQSASHKYRSTFHIHTNLKIRSRTNMWTTHTAQRARLQQAPCRSPPLPWRTCRA
jgi:hypothetical protein